MQPEQQRILGYFIEEAKEHLATIESSLLSLQTVVDDPEMMNEVFRAAHSVKGGAAMLGIHSMQHIAHRLEDYFKVLKEHPIQVDQKLESLFFKSFDALSALTEELESSLSLSEDLSERMLHEVEPVFADLQSHLSQLTGVTVEASEVAVAQAQPQAVTPEEVVAVFSTDILLLLRRMLPLFQREDTTTTRQSLQEVCAQLSEIGTQLNLEHWQTLVLLVSDAIAESQNSLSTLAAVIIPELKAARDQVLGHQWAVTPSELLLSLVPQAAPAQTEADIDWSGLFDASEAEGTNTAVAAESSFDFFLDELLEEPAASPAASAPEITPAAPERVADFGELAALLADDEAEAVHTAPEPAVDTAQPETKVDEFEDLERLLGDNARTIAGSTSAQPNRAKTPARAVRRGSSTQTMKVPLKQLDNLSNQIGELVVNRNTLEDNQDRSRQFLENLLFQVQQLNELGQKMQDLYERSLLEGSLLSASQRSGTAAGQGVALMEKQAGDGHASGYSFDALEMDSFTGFHTLSQEMIERIVRVREAAADIEFVVNANEQVTRMFRQVTTQVQEGLTQARMIPFSQIAERLPRAVRDISLKCGKQAQLDIEGQDTLIDKGILERIYDPLTHLVNNAIYHGIESPETRQALGKNPEGHIRIRAFYQGNQTIISITDDGAGIDVERVKSKAVENGLLTAQEAAQLSRQEAYNLLFQSGFSTNDQADQLAGRGVGMDVVRSYISEIRGVINTDSTPQKGTTFTIRLPLTLSITKALCCVHQGHSIAFPIDGVEDVIDMAKEQVLHEDDKTYVQWRDRRLLCKPLNQLLPYNRSVRRGGYQSQTTTDKVSVVILRSGDDLVALQLDDVLGEQEIVIKQLVGPVPKPVGIAGVTVQGDGRVMPIADVLELVELSLDRLEVTHKFWQGVPDLQMEEVQAEPMVLIVDDSITVRELLSMTFSKVGYRVEQARDGQEAWEKLRSGLPCDVVFCDVEMPRMDGLELLSRLQQDEDLQDLPVAMLTSRGASRHKQMAVDLGAKGYFTKPYLEEALLDAAQRMINGEVLLK